ncbi:unnamed protein product [Urochloa humidicola]
MPAAGAQHATDDHKAVSCHGVQQATCMREVTAAWGDVEANGFAGFKGMAPWRDAKYFEGSSPVKKMQSLNSPWMA